MNESAERWIEVTGVARSVVDRPAGWSPHYLHELDTRRELPDGFSFDVAVHDARRALDPSRTD